MVGLKAALYKDFKLFLRGSGLLALALPFLLLLAFRAGMGDLSAQAYVQPFPIAVRDLDNTLMSRSLIGQMGRIELFSQVELLEEGVTDRQALEQGAAAVVSVPQDFFYDLYTMEDCPVAVTLNNEMELEAALFQSIFTSVMDIIRADQAAGRGLYRFLWGELTPELERAMYAETSDRLLQDALSRQGVFDAEAGQADLQGALERRLLACVLAVLALFFSLAAVKTLPEELGLGVLPRFRASGGFLGAFVFSKLLTAGLLALPTLLLLALVFRPGNLALTALLTLLLLLGGFGLMLAVTAWAGGPVAAQRWGNLLLLASLVLGGTLWPRHLLPGPLPALGKLSLPYYAALGLEVIHRGGGPAQLLALIWPAPLMGLAGALLALPRLKRGRREAPTQEEQALPSSALPDHSPALQGLLPRLAGLSRLKLGAMVGGYAGLAALLCACLLCGGAALAARQGEVSALRLAVLDLDGTSMSQELVRRLGERAGLSLSLPEEAEGRQLLLLGEVEGLLTIGEGYAAALEAGADPPLHYEGAASASSVQGAREIVAGQVAAQRSRIWALRQAEERLERPMSQQDALTLTGYISQAEEEAPPLYHIALADGAPSASPFVPHPVSFAALAVLLTLLTAASWGGGADGRLVERRMYALPWGRLLSYGSDCLALTGLGLLAALAILLPGGLPEPGLLPAAGSYAFCSAALALALVRFTALEGRVDALAPFLALILCLVGGCFMDLSQFSPAMARLALSTPPGLALRAAEGGWTAAAVLTGEGFLLLLLGMPRRRL